MGSAERVERKLINNHTYILRKYLSDFTEHNAPESAIEVTIACNVTSEAIAASVKLKRLILQQAISCGL
jgi:hypothetical protein